jgi:6-aminohexanoate-oligomer endohydrolase
LLLAGIVNPQSGGQAQAKLQPRPSADGPALEFPSETAHLGTAEYDEGPTGLTVLYFPSKVVAAVDLRGGSPGTSGTDAIRLGYDTATVDAVARDVLSTVRRHGVETGGRRITCAAGAL